jgi:thermitase
MRLFSRLVYFLLIFCLLIPGGSSRAGCQADLNGGLLVRLAADFSNQAGRDWLRSQGYAVVGEIAALHIYQLAPASSPACAVMQALDLKPQVEFVEVDGQASATGEITPNDPYFASQWALQKIRMPQAWSLTSQAEPVIIAILDSGIQRDHPDLAAKVWRNLGEIPGNLRDDDANGKIDDVNGWHFYHDWNGTSFDPRENANIEDDYGHGTHVSGIAAAVSNNAIGISGIAWEAKILSVKVLDQYGVGWYSDIAAGIVYAVDNGAKVLNLSLGGASSSETLQAAAAYASAHGALVIASSGNDGGAVYYPAAIPSVLAVAASDPSDQHPSFSNFGPEIDLAAPGTDILSTWLRSDYLYRIGTSMAAPQVAGVGALLWSQYPGLGSQDVTRLLLDNLDDIQDPGFDPTSGWGRLNAEQSMAAAQHLPDAWVDLDPLPFLFQFKQPVSLTLQYGNQGTGPVQEAVLTAELQSETQVISSTWKLGNLPASSGVFSQTWDLAAIDATFGITLSLQIASPSIDRDRSNDRIERTARPKSLFWMPFLPMP